MQMSAPQFGVGRFRDQPPASGIECHKRLATAIAPDIPRYISYISCETALWRVASETRLPQFGTIEIHHETEQLHHHPVTRPRACTRDAEGHRLHR